MKISDNLAIITSGGGMKCAYSAGAIHALATELDITRPDIYVSASGSTGTMFYYLAQQYDDIEKIWTRYLPSPHFIRYAPFPALRINYLIDTVAKKYLPLDVEKVEYSPTKFFMPVTDSESGETRFLNKGLWFNPYEMVRAATAIPIFYNKNVWLGGRNYLDGDFSTSTNALVQKAIAEGATRILCISNTDSPSETRKSILRAYGRLLKPGLRKALMDDLADDQAIHIPEGVQYVCLSPSSTLPAVLYSREPRKIKEAFYMGREDLLAKAEEIRALFTA
ncbi:MAG: hypothetical protein KBC16_00245 [Candidatus Pacebacteria bacterium]|nr:hypothetical protein [Candidatus Paceibacterota bacterium]